MKRRNLFIMILALALLLYGGAAAAEARNAITGEWYGALLGYPVTLTLNEDGTYLLSVRTGTQVGTWEQAEGALFLDRDTADERRLPYDGVSLVLDDVRLTREPVDPFLASPVRQDATLEEFQGDWVCVRISLFGELMSVEEYGETTLSITDTHMVRTDLGETQGYEGEFFGGELRFLDAPVDSEPVTMTLRLHEDGMLSLNIPFGEETGIISYFVRPEALEDGEE